MYALSTVLGRDVSVLFASPASQTQCLAIRFK